MRHTQSQRKKNSIQKAKEKCHNILTSFIRTMEKIRSKRARVHLNNRECYFTVKGVHLFQFLIESVFTPFLAWKETAERKKHATQKSYHLAICALCAFHTCHIRLHKNSHTYTICTPRCRSKICFLFLRHVNMNWVFVLFNICIHNTTWWPQLCVLYLYAQPLNGLSTFI